jgi:hypothetical protein
MISFHAVVAYCSNTCCAAETMSSITRGYTGARSVVTSTGDAPWLSARAKNALAAAASRRADQHVDHLTVLVDRTVE